MIRRFTAAFFLCACLLAPAWAQQPQNLSQVGGTSVSLFAPLLSSVAATATASSSTAIRPAGGSLYGTLQITESGITGSPAGCTIALYPEPIAGTEGSTALTTVSFTPSTGVQTVRIAPSLPVVDQLIATYSCGTYPTAGTLSVSLTSQTSAWAEIHGAVWPASYAANTGKIAASSTTDNACLPGNATNTVYLSRVILTGYETTTGAVTVTLIKRSAADSGGTSASITAVPDDANYPAAVSAPLSYTSTGPTAGAAIGNLDSALVTFYTSSTSANVPNYVFDRRWKPIALRGTAQEVCLNTGNAALTGGEITVTFEWEERP